MIKDIAKKYFQAFAKKDINSLREMFSANIVLRDWEICVDGIDAVLDANLKIFNVSESITVTPINIFQIEKVVIAELEIEINAFDPIKVVDILEFTDAGKIGAIRAFRG